jgi:SAM-dependent methyltransferase
MSQMKLQIKSRAASLLRASRTMVRHAGGMDGHSCPPMGSVRFGSLRRTNPIAGSFGYGRGGTRIGRHYVSQFIQANAKDIHGRVLEIGDRHATKAFGGDRVTQSDVLHAEVGNPEATVVGDLATGEGVPVGVYDCIILTQVIQFIYDVRSAIKHTCAALKPGGVVLLTTQSIGQVSRYDMDRWGDYWRFTTDSAKALFEEHLPRECVEVSSCGNVLAATAFLHGLSLEELTAEEIDYNDPDYQIIVTVRAQKPVDS